MQPTLCSRCKTNMAVIFITKLENGQAENEGLCLKCARELGIQPIDDMIKKMGLSEDDLENLTTEMMSAFGEEINEENESNEANEENDDGNTATFPFLNKIFDNNNRPPVSEPSSDSKEKEEKRKKPKSSGKKFLDNYCISLSQQARDGKIDALVGRDRELARVIQILNRRQKNNPCLIGEPGVGKTAIAEGLAMRIHLKEVPYKLQDKEVYLLDLTALVAGTQFRGQFESRIRGLIEEIRRLKNIILMVDEVHGIVSAGDADGAMSAANIMKPALSRGEIQIIGATTLKEYRKYIEKDSALERRFQPIIVEEPSIEEAVEVISGVAKHYAEFHKVEISPEMCRLSVVLAERYITDRFLPDKAIDLIDEACSSLNLENKSLIRLSQVEKDIADLAKEREVIMATSTDESYCRLANIRSQELRLESELSELKEAPLPVLSVDNLANVIELWTNIPASQIEKQEYKRLAELPERLKGHIVGQDDAVAAVASAVRRRRVDISAKRKPVSFIFVGSTGVGKTELVKQLATDLFNTPEALIRLDMSEFMEKHTVSRMVGAPPGYVGHDDAGQLTEKIRRKPYSIILFDEMEKAHPDVLNVLLQILDDGHITDAQGRIVNFENTVIVMTSNAGSGKQVGSVGFDKTINEQNKERAMKALEEFLRPEFINRIDEIVYFNQLTEDDFEKIAEIMLNDLKKAMSEKGILLTWEDNLLQYLSKTAYSTVYGARNLRRLIQKELEDKIAMEMIENYEKPLKAILATSKEDTVVIQAEY
ncbi:MAG: ATP-dependent Clp protease ATP-binding subunit [Eubacteriales bacterium]